MGVIRYGRTAQIGVYPGNQSGRFISYRSGGKKFPLDPDTQIAWNFARDKSLTDLVRGLTLDFARASTATYYDSAGNLQTALANEPRFDHDPVTKESLGLLIEESRTNLFLQSDTPATQDIATTAQAYTISVWGTGDITVSGSATGTATEGNPLTVTATAGTLTCTVNGSLDRAQVEAGGFPTSYIPTTTASVTRAADDCTSTDKTWWNDTEGTFYTNTVRQYAQTIRPGTIGDTADHVSHRLLAGLAINYNGVNGTTVENYNFSSGAAEVLGQPVKMATAWAQDDVAGYGQGVGSNPAVSFTPPPASQLAGIVIHIGRFTTSINHLNGHIREFGYANVRKDNAFLQELTNP